MEFWIQKIQATDQDDFWLGSSEWKKHYAIKSFLNNAGVGNITENYERDERRN